MMIFQTAFTQKIEEKSLLWEISGNGLEQTSYLFGTVHLVCKGEVIMTDLIQKTFDNTTALALEVDLSDPSIQIEMMKLSISKDGKKISDGLDQETADKLDQLLQSKMSVPLAMMDALSPQMMLMQLSLFGLDCPMDLGYDYMFMQSAIAEEKEIIGLESIQAQMDALFSQPDEEVFQAITYLVNNPDELKEQTSEVFSLYKNQEIQALYDYTKESYDDPKYPTSDIKVLLDNRNISWIPVIEAQISKESTFIAVGAAHLAGENGVINLLKKQGYNLKPVL